LLRQFVIGSKLHPTRRLVSVGPLKHHPMRSKRPFSVPSSLQIHMFLTHFHRALDFESGEERIAVLIWRPEALWLQSHITKLREGAELASEEQEEEVGPSAITTSLQRGNTLKSRSRKKIETSESSKKLCLNAKGEAIRPSDGSCWWRLFPNSVM
jgi:hypothetical protein